MSNRRQFLKGQAAARALADMVQTAVGEDVDPVSQPYLVQLKRWAMACHFELYLNAGQYDDATEVALAAFDLIEALEAQLTVYRETSEVLQLNEAAFSRPVAVETRFFDLLCRAAQLHRDTAGAFDITSGPLSKTWGFYRRAGSIPSESDLAAARERVGGQWLELDPVIRSVRFQRAGMELNLGSIGKGYALDRAAEVMAASGIQDFLWHGGQSSVLARGKPADARLDRPGWIVGVGHPLRPDRRLVEICLVNRALATSGSSVQFFRHGGKRYGHILDPRTGWPAEGVFSSTVIADTAAEADALSTAFYVLGVESALEYCRQHPGIAALILYPSANGSKVQWAAAGFEQDPWRLVADDADDES